MKIGAFNLVVGFALIKICACGFVLSEPQNLTATDIQSCNLTISWQKPSNDSNQTISYNIFYKEQKGQCWEELTGVKHTKATLTQLKPYRVYDIFVMAETNGVYGAPSSRLKETTQESVPDSCPSIGEYLYEAPDLSWQVVPEDDRNGIILGYTIFYRNSSMPNGTYNKVNTTKEGTKYTHHNISNLNSGAGYTFKIVAFNSKGYCKGYENMTMWNLPHTTPSPIPTSTVSSSPQATSFATMTTSQPETTTQLKTLATASASPTTTQTAISTSPTLTTPSSSSTSPTQTPSTIPTKRTTTSTEKPEPTQQPCPTIKPCTCPTSTQEPTEEETEQPAEKLASSKNDDWLKYVAIALAVLVVIMGISIFILIWQLYKNHRFYKLRRQGEVYKMKQNDQLGHDNQAQDNP